MSFWSWIGLADKKEMATLQSEISVLREENKAFQEQNLKLFKEIQEANKKSRDVITNEVSNNRRQTEELIQHTNGHIEQLVSSVADYQAGISNSYKQINTQINECIRILNENNRIVNEKCEVIQQVFKSECEDTRAKIEVIRKHIIDKLQANYELSTSHNQQVLKEIAKHAEGIESILSKFQELMTESHECIWDNHQLIKESENQIDNLASMSKQIEQKTDNIDIIQEQLSSLSESMKYLWSIMKAIWVDSVLSDIDSLGEER